MESHATWFARLAKDQRKRIHNKADVALRRVRERRKRRISETYLDAEASTHLQCALGPRRPDLDGWIGR